MTGYVRVLGRIPHGGGLLTGAVRVFGKFPHERSIFPPSVRVLPQNSHGGRIFRNFVQYSGEIGVIKEAVREKL